MSGIKYFTLEEMIESSTAKKNGLANIPNWDEAANLRELVENVLDPLREWYGKPIYVNSGYRCKELNSLVGGVSNSQHVGGFAVDATVNSTEGNQKLFDYIKDNMEFDQLIDEKNMSWVHVSYNKGNNRKQVLYL